MDEHFDHPISGKQVCVVSRLPDDLVESLAELATDESGSIVDVNGDPL